MRVIMVIVVVSRGVDSRRAMIMWRNLVTHIMIVVIR